MKSKDPVLGQVIDVIGTIEREVYTDIFVTLVHAIIGQLISTQAQEAIWNQFLIEFSPITPKHKNTFDTETLKSVGLTKRKAEYIKEIAMKIETKTLDIEKLRTFDDHDVIKELTKLKGVGPWTAEMVLIFALQRPNVISFKDVVIIRGLKILYKKEEITPEFFDEIKKRYSPYTSVASLYLWKF